MPDVDPRLLRPFLVLARELHFTRAAAELYIAQPALSQQISRLERQVGASLFIRSSRGVTLTPAGEILLAHVRPGTEQIDAGIREAQRVGDGLTGRLRVGFLSSLAGPVIPRVISGLQSQAPGITVELTERTMTAQVADLRAGRIDVGLFTVFDGVTLDSDGLDLEVLVDGPQYLVVPAGHRFAHHTEIDLADAAEELFVMPSGTDQGGYRGAVLAVARRHGFTMRPGAQADNIATMLGLVASGLGITVVAWPVTLSDRPGITYVRLIGERGSIVAARIPRASALTDTLVATARDVLTELVPPTD